MRPTPMLTLRIDARLSRRSMPLWKPSEKRNQTMANGNNPASMGEMGGTGMGAQDGSMGKCPMGMQHMRDCPMCNGDPKTCIGHGGTGHPMPKGGNMGNMGDM